VSISSYSLFKSSIIGLIVPTTLHHAILLRWNKATGAQEMHLHSFRPYQSTYMYNALAHLLDACFDQFVFCNNMLEVAALITAVISAIFADERCMVMVATRYKLTVSSSQSEGTV
jgi:hypothetical protein